MFCRDAAGDASECLMFRLGSRFGRVAARRRRLPCTHGAQNLRVPRPYRQTDVVRLDADRSVESSIFHSKKAEEIQTVRIASSLPFVPCLSTWGESCSISLPAAPEWGVA